MRHAPRLRTLVFAAAVLLCLCAPAPAQIRDADWNTFVESSYARFREPNEPLGFEDHLHEAALSHRVRADAIAAFAARIRVPRDLAAQYAAVIVESVRRQRDGCDGPCRFRRGDPFYDRVARLAAEPTGQLLVAIGKDLDAESRLHAGGWIALAVRHPASQQVLEALFDYTREVPLVVAMFASTNPVRWDPEYITTATNRDEYGPDAWDGWLDAFIEVAEERARASHAPLAVRAAVAQLSVDRELRVGLTQDAVDRYLGYPSEIRSNLPVAAQSQGDCSADPYAFADDLAAALWQTDHRSEARAMLSAERANLGPRPRRARDRFAALSDSLAATTAAPDLFDRYLVGDSGGEPSCNPDRAGWLDAVMQSPAIRPLAEARLRKAGYQDIASAVGSGGLYPRDAERGGVLSGYARFFPETVRARHLHWATAIDKVWHAKSQSVAPRGAVHVKARAEPPAWKELPLPRGMRPWTETDAPARALAGLRLPVDPEAVIRYEAVDGEHAIVYHSSDYDQSGEVPAFGIWFTRTERGTWSRPVFLGIQQYFPYVVTPGSRLPLVNGDRLQLEVQVRQIDAATITFPPVATSLRRSASGVYLAIDLAQARRDRDGDGLSDIEERTLGLDPDHADTDGDGIPDDIDPLPLTAYRPDAPVAESTLARAVLMRIWGHDSQAIVVGPAATSSPEVPDTTHTRSETIFLVGNPDMFAGLATTPRRLIVYTEEDLRALGRDAAPFYPPVVHVFSSLDGLRHYVQWSANWAGGRFLVTCPSKGATCQTTDLSSWVS